MISYSHRQRRSALLIHALPAVQVYTMPKRCLGGHLSASPLTSHNSQPLAFLGHSTQTAYRLAFSWLDRCSAMHLFCEQQERLNPYDLSSGPTPSNYKSAIQTNYANKQKRPIRRLAFFVCYVVGTAGFELATPCTPCKCATRLRYAPNRFSPASCSHSKKGVHYSGCIRYSKVLS